MAKQQLEQRLEEQKRAQLFQQKRAKAQGTRLRFVGEPPSTAELLKQVDYLLQNAADRNA